MMACRAGASDGKDAFADASVTNVARMYARMPRPA